jgi:hypothetical protein
MKKILGMAVLVLLISIPAHGQMGKSGGVGASASSAPSQGGGGGVNGGAVDASRPRLPSYPSAQFGVSAVSGGDPSYAPSAFLTFDQAVAEGKATMAAEQKSLAQVAAENIAAQKAKAKFAFVQDAQGRVVPAEQK